MDTLQVATLLDVPSPRYLLTVPFIKRAGEMFEVCGWANRKRRLTSAEVTELVDSRLAKRLPSGGRFERLGPNYSGRLPWVGEEFHTSVMKLGKLPEWVDLLPENYLEGLGWALDMDAGTFFGLRTAWLLDLAQELFTSKSAAPALVELMRRMDLSNEFTQAAVWWSFRGEPERQRHYLEWLVKLARDNSAPEGLTETRLIADFERVVRVLSEV